ncbi:MAG TPA: hypothetical protein PKM78_03140 [Anaerolineae bacterium]|nr:hypothetical protein [Anaerolineae bacterium]HNU04395.1 hypothetical protein [Anaerolineae bacterium]
MTIQERPVDLPKILELTHGLSLLDKVRLVEHVMPQIERELAFTAKTPKRSLLGICADLGPAPSAETIDEARREMWANFPREVE